MQITYKINIRTIAIVLYILLVLLCVGYFVGQDLPQSLILWVTTRLWLATPIVNINNIFSNRKD